MSVAMVTQNSAAPSIWASGATAATTPTSDATSFSAATQSGSSSSNTAAPSGVTIPFQQLANDLQAMLVQLQQTETGTAANGGTSTTATGTTGTSDATTSGTDASSARPHHHHHHHSDTQATGPGKLQADAARLLSDLNGGTSPSGSAASLTAPAGSAAAPASAANDGSANSLAAIQAYTSAAAQSASLPAGGTV